MFRYISGLPIWACLIELLNVFGIRSPYDAVSRKRSEMTNGNLVCKFDKVVFSDINIFGRILVCCGFYVVF